MGQQARPAHPLLRSRLRHLLNTLYPSFSLRRNAFTPLSLLSICFVLSLIAMGFYLVVPIALLPYLASNPFPTALWLALFLWSVCCTLTSYLLTALSEPGRVPSSWRPTCWREEPMPPEPHASATVVSSALNARGTLANTTPATTTAAATATATGATTVPPTGAAKATTASTATTTSSTLAKRPPDSKEATQFPQASPDVHAAGTAMVRPDGRYRFCVHCNVFKPDRAHHCSTCKECVLQMDHHCPFTGNSCVGLQNRKFFVLFLYYATLSCGLVAGLTPKALVRTVFADPQEPLTAAGFGKTIVLLMGYVLCSLHALALAPFAAFHTYLVVKNRTTIENQEVRQPLHLDVLARSDRGCLGNWKAIFGPRPWLWFVPVSYGREWDGLRWTAARPGSAAGDDMV